MPERVRDTRRALLEAGGEVFARCGFKDATVRDICAKAGANVAAVRYHFGDKAGLYTAVIAYAAECAAARYPIDLDPDRAVPAELRLRRFVRSFLYRLLDPGRPAWQAALMVRELAEPTHAFERVFNDLVRPLFEHLTVIVHDLLGGRADERSVRLATHSIMGQCTFYRHGRFLSSHLYGGPPPGLEQVDDIADFIVDFSLSGLAPARQVRQSESRA